MDNTSEEQIKHALAPCIVGKTLLLVTHRASMLSLVDRLIIVDKGRIIADGPKAVVMDALKKRADKCVSLISGSCSPHCAALFSRPR